MTKRDLFSVALKVLGVYLFSSSIMNISQYIARALAAMRGEMASILDSRQIVAANIVSILLWVTVAALLIAGSDKIAKWLIREDAPIPAIDFKRDARSIFIIAAKIMGVSLIAEALIAMSQGLASTFFNASYVEQTLTGIFAASFWATQKALVVALLLKISIGLYLAFGTNSLANLLYPEQRPMREETANLPGM